MTDKKGRRRIGVLIVVPLLIVLLGVLGGNLLRELRGLSTADADNLQWTILQVETEIANLNATLSEAANDPSPDVDAVRLRADIALSRLLIVGRGEARDLFPGDAADLLARVNAYQDDMIAVLDADPGLSENDIIALRDLTRDIRPDIRDLVLLGLEAGTNRASARRAGFARQLTITGAIAIAVIVGLSAVLVVLDRLLARADQRDTELLNSSSRLASTVTASLDAIVTANEAGEIIEFNASAERIFGWSREEILGQKMEATIIPHQHRKAHAAGMERYLATHEPHVVDAGRVELSALRKSGEEFPVELNITSVESANGELFIAYLRDISQRKINEQKLIDARDKAEAMDRAKSQFLAVMSHEMRTPLNGILGVLDLMRQTRLTKQQDRYMRVASASGEILLEHVNEALDITRIEMGSMQLSPHPFEMRPAVQSVCDVLTPLAQEKGLSLSLDFDPGMDRIFDGDGARIGQILTNLIGNAIKFTEDGQIVVSVSGIHGADLTNATITVSDTGRGIPEDRLEDVFEDFVALAHSEGRQARGDGLGLSISRKVARLMGGELSVQSTIGQGSVFTLRIPLARAKAVAEAASNEIADERLADTAQTKHILVVEDNAINRSVLRDMLERLGHSVTEASDGLDGLHQAQQSAFDLIIMDVSMPVMDGIETARRIRAEAGPNQRTRIVGLTAHGREEYRDRAIRAGMDGFFTKPIRFSALHDVVSADAQSASPAGLDAEVIDDLIDVLGPEKVKATADAFFAESETQLDVLSSPESDVAAILHKMRGGAALLGLKSVITQIDALDGATMNRQAVAALQGAISAGRKDLTDRLQQTDPTG
ncbi:hybrid sensor histidine kinase/response regulator [Gymnodinialimonas hymeniacidonis]|uniref:hybrid sensor histidine kinase/response regulator n=1 Tax=Gymnodinialimonas hymeniacidonis TaxID=3126508 RepID=UPI0034C5DD04